MIPRTGSFSNVLTKEPLPGNTPCRFIETAEVIPALRADSKFESLKSMSSIATLSGRRFISNSRLIGSGVDC
ncbi:hypothetical protein IIB79_07610 [candidate division KSB1 bacterium]|nr:hypothetical protein [candidate division KSB1 bacterium]